MQQVNIDWSEVVTAEQKAAKARAAKELAVKVETTLRIESRWNKVGQNNAALGLYTAAERDECISWINTHRAACQVLLGRTDLLELDITDNSLWPPSDKG